MKTLLSILLLGLLIASPRPERQGKDYALFFAVSEYQHGSLTDLPQPVQNARAIAEELENRFGFRCEVVENPTRRQIEDLLYAYRDRFDDGQLPNDGQLFVFFSGHGVREDRNGYFLPADANPDRVPITSLAYNVWRPFIDGFNCRHVLVVVDACYSLTFDPDWDAMGDDDNDRRFGRKGQPTEAQQLRTNFDRFPSRLFFTSDAQEDIVPGRSNFARKLLDGLAHHYSPEGFVSADDLFRGYLKRAQPTPNAGDFGTDDVRSNFLFFYQSSNGDRLASARSDRTAWQAAEEANTPTAFRQYLRSYPDGDFKEAAEGRLRSLDEAAWRSAQRGDTEAAYRRYLGSFPEGRYASAARNRIQQVRDEARELTAWEQAKTTDTREAYQAFIDAYPNSVYRTAAEGKRNVLGIQAHSFEFPIPEMKRIPGGTFTMGSNDGDGDEKPPHQVTVSSFDLGIYEVTFAEYDAFCEATGRSKPDDQGWGRGRRPVINVSWNDATAYAAWLSEQTGQNWRLPTEAEWEYAAGGGSSSRTKYAGTAAESSLSQYGNFCDANCDQSWKTTGQNDGAQYTTRVGSYRPNALGLYDMSGNVWEWCQDWYGSDYYASSPSSNPQGPATGSYRVNRGGSWRVSPRRCRVAYRNVGTPTLRHGNLGFRLARTP